MLLTLARNGASIVRLLEYHLSADLKAGTVGEIRSGQTQEADEVLYGLYEKQKHVSSRVAAFLNFVNEHFKEGAESWC